MIINKYKYLKHNKNYILENFKQAKVYLDKGLLSKEELEMLKSIAPDPKYLGWMSMIWTKEKDNLSINDLRNKVEEYNVFLKKGKAPIKDVSQFYKEFPTFDRFKKAIDSINSSGEAISNADLEKDYEVIVDNSDMYIAVPHTHEASRKLGLSKFAFRDCEEGGKDSAWCTTYKAPDHFNDYYYAGNVTFYYIKVLSSKLINKLKKEFPEIPETPDWKSLQVVALAILEDNTIDGYDGLDQQMSPKYIKKYMSILGLTRSK